MHTMGGTNVSELKFWHVFIISKEKSSKALHFLSKISNLPTLKKIFLGTRFLGSSENLDSGG